MNAIVRKIGQTSPHIIFANGNMDEKKFHLVINSEEARFASRLLRWILRLAVTAQVGSATSTRRSASPIEKSYVVALNYKSEENSEI